jgi:hypothetical protein
MIFPNPATHVITVSSKQLIEGKYSLMISNLSGKVILEETATNSILNEKIVVFNWPHGLYYIFLKEKGNIVIQSLFIKE